MGASSAPALGVGEGRTLLRSRLPPPPPPLSGETEEFLATAHRAIRLGLVTLLTYGTWRGRVHFLEVAFATGNSQWVSYNEWAAQLRSYTRLQLQLIVELRRTWLKAGAPRDFRRLGLPDTWCDYVDGAF